MYYQSNIINNNNDGCEEMQMSIQYQSNDRCNITVDQSSMVGKPEPKIMNENLRTLKHIIP